METEMYKYNENPITDSHKNLPGFRADYFEGGGKQRDNGEMKATTDSILIIGSSSDGPVGEPVSVSSVGGLTSASEMFGGLIDKVEYERDGRKRYAEAPNNNTLVRALHEAHDRGSDNIYLLRPDGRAAKSEIFVEDPNASVSHPLADDRGDSKMNGNMEQVVDFGIKNDESLLSVTSVTETRDGEPIIHSKSDVVKSTSVDKGFEGIVLRANKMVPGNQASVKYQVAKKNYIEVTRNENGVIDPESTKAILTKSLDTPNYFESEVGFWSEDPSHIVTVTIVETDSEGEVVPYMINSMTSNFRLMYRIGREDDSLDNPETDLPSAKELEQGGIRLTPEFFAEAANYSIPDMTDPDCTYQIIAEYTYYNSAVEEKDKAFTVSGQDRARPLRSVPDVSTLLVTATFDKEVKELELEKDYTITIPSGVGSYPSIIVKHGVVPIGAELKVFYESGALSGESAKIILSGYYAGEAYGSIEDPSNHDTVKGVKFSVENGENKDGTPDYEDRILRIYKPTGKMLSSVDNVLSYSLKELNHIHTLTQFTNYVNNDKANNVIRLEVPTGFGSIPVAGLIVTDHLQNPDSLKMDYRKINLGEKLSETTDLYELYEDLNQELLSADRFPWLGDNGFYDKTSLKDMRKYYDLLGGVYGIDLERDPDNPVLVDSGIYTYLENFPVAYVNLADVYANTAVGKLDGFGEYELDLERNFATQLAQFTATLSARTDNSHGIISMAPLPGTSLLEVQEAIDLFAGYRKVTTKIEDKYLQFGINANYKNEHLMYDPITLEEIFNHESKPIDIGFFISVVFGPDVGISLPRIGSYVTPGSSAYVSLISVLPAEISTTNHQIQIEGLRYRLSNAQHNQILGFGYVTFDVKRTLRGTSTYVVKDGITASSAESDYRQLSTIRIVNLAVHVTRRETDKYIGKGGGLGHKSAISADIKDALDSLKSRGIIKDFLFEMHSSMKDHVLGQIFVDLDIVPAYEIRRIRTRVATTPMI